MGKERLSRMARQPLEYGQYRQRAQVEAAAVDAWLALYRRRLNQLAELCRERGVRLILMGEPEMFFDNAYNAKDLLDDRELGAIESKIRAGNDLWRMELEYFVQGRLDREMQRFGQEHDVPFFDGAGVFPADRNRFFVDQIHPNGAGASKIADGLSEFLTALPAAQPAQPTASGTAIGDGPSNPYATNMRQTYQAVQHLDARIAAKDFDGAVIDATRLRSLLAESDAFWAARPDAADAQRAAKGAVERASEIEQAARAHDHARARDALRAMGGTCKTCHDVHRARFADGRSGIR